jgi:hypothetical protein
MNTKTYANYTSFLFPLFPFLPFFFSFPPSISFYLSHSHTFSVPSSPPLLFIFPYSKFPSDLPSSISLRHLSFLSHTLLLVLFHFLFSHLFPLPLSRLFPFYLVCVFSLFILSLSVSISLFTFLYLFPYFPVISAQARNLLNSLFSSRSSPFKIYTSFFFIDLHPFLTSPVPYRLISRPSV